MQPAAAYIPCFTDFLCSSDLQLVCETSKTDFISDVKVGIFREIHLFIQFTQSFIFPELNTELFRKKYVLFPVIFFQRIVKNFLIMYS